MTNVTVEMVKKIPCELSVITENGQGSAWLSCRECARCLLVAYMESNDSYLAVRIAALPDNGGYEIRKDLRNSQEGGKP